MSPPSSRRKEVGIEPIRYPAEMVSPEDHLRFAEERLARMTMAMQQERARRKAAILRIKFLETVIAEFSAATPHRTRDEWGTITPKLRFAVLLRDKFSCTYCGLSHADGAKLQVDHVKPRSAGGKTVLSNLRAACSACNQGKSTMLVELDDMARVEPSRSLQDIQSGGNASRYEPLRNTAASDHGAETVAADRRAASSLGVSGCPP